MGGSNSPDYTMANIGCAVTAAAMLMKSYGVSHVPTGNLNSTDWRTTELNPGTFNTALTNYMFKGMKNVGFSPEANLNWPGAAAIARVGFYKHCVSSGNNIERCVDDALAKVSFLDSRASFSESDRLRVENEICEGNPVILKLQKANGRFRNAMDAYPVTAGYRLYKSIRDPSQLMIHSSINTHFVLTDPTGRRVGFNPITNTAYNEIPEARYMIEDVSPPAEAGFDQNLGPQERHLSMSEGVINGQYNLVVFGVARGNFHASMNSYDEVGYPNDQILESGTIATGQSVQINFVHDDKAAPEPNGTLIIDSLTLKIESANHFKDNNEAKKIWDQQSGGNMSIYFRKSVQEGSSILYEVAQIPNGKLRWSKWMLCGNRVPKAETMTIDPAPKDLVATIKNGMLEIPRPLKEVFESFKCYEAR